MKIGKWTPTPLPSKDVFCNCNWSYFVWLYLILILYLNLVFKRRLVLPLIILNIFIFFFGEWMNIFITQFQLHAFLHLSLVNIWGWILLVFVTSMAKDLESRYKHHLCSLPSFQSSWSDSLDLSFLLENANGSCSNCHSRLMCKNQLSTYNNNSSRLLNIYKKKI